MKNTSKNKQLLSFSITPELRSEFIALSKLKSINKSNLLSVYIQKWINENKEYNI
jgi:hypothetical protein